MSTMNESYESFLSESLHKPEQIILGMWVCCVHPHQSTGTKNTYKQNPHRSFRRCVDRGLASHCWVIIAAAPVLLLLLVWDTLGQLSSAAAVLSSSSFLFFLFFQLLKRGPHWQQLFQSCAPHKTCLAAPTHCPLTPATTSKKRQPSSIQKGQAKTESSSRLPWLGLT